MPTPKQLKKAATNIAKSAKTTAEERTAQAVALAGRIDALQLQHSGTVIEARSAESRAEAATILARLADSDLLPVVLGERKPDQAEVTALVRRGLMWRGGGFCYTGPTDGWQPIRLAVVALYRELATTPEDR